MSNKHKNKDTLQGSTERLNNDLEQAATTLQGEDKNALIANNRVLYETLQDMWWDEREIIKVLMAQEAQKDDEVTIGEDGQVYYKVGLRISYPVDVIKEIHPDWDNYKVNRQRNILEGLGFNTRKYNFFTQYGLYRDKDNELRYGKIVYGQERTDVHWATKRVDGKLVASIEAIAASGYRKFGYDFREDLV